MNVSPSPQPGAGTVDGRYAIRRRLGSGSTGTVYLAWDPTERRQVALKIIRTEQMVPSRGRAMQDEFRAFALLDHPQIAKAYDFGYTEAGIPYYTREYVAGTPLPPGPPGTEAPDRFLRPVLDLLEALEYLHARRLLHLDVHAGNLVVADDDTRGSVLIDFGLVRTRATPPLTSAGGTDSWSSLPPELLQGDQVDPRTDLFLVGRLLHYRLTGRWHGKLSLPREIPGWGTRRTLELERILVKALQPDPERRFPSAGAFREALGRALGNAPSSPRPGEAGQAIVGRARELGALQRALDAASGGGSALVVLGGPEGSGKTRLLAETRLWAQLRGLYVVDLRFPSEPGPGPALLAALRRERSTREPGGGWLAALDPRCGGTPRERARRTAEAFFRHDARPLVLLLDDIDAADGESGMLAEALAAECARREASGATGRGLAMVIAGRRMPAGLSIPRSRRRAIHHLAPLRPAEARDLLLGFLGGLRGAEVPPRTTIREALRAAAGSPLRLRQAAAFLKKVRGRWSEVTAAGIRQTWRDVAEDLADWRRLPAPERAILEVLAIIGRAASRDEIAEALSLERAGIDRALRRLRLRGTIESRGAGSHRRYHILHPERGREIASRAPRGAARRVHRRLAGFLSRPDSSGRVDLSDRENLALHLLAAGRRREGLRAAREAARLLRGERYYERAVKLLEMCRLRERSPLRQLALAEEISSILEETGDHEKGIAVVGPFCRSRHGSLPSSAAVRVRRRLGVHCHRSGLAGDALRAFGEAQALADPARDLEEIIFIDSELAELQLFLGCHDQAERACRRGLERLDRGAVEAEFGERMRVLFHASLGHIAMRSLRLPEARRELTRALRLSSRTGPSPDRAGILQNLAIVENQLNDFTAASKHFLEAERVLRRSGNQREAIKIHTNLALVEAKLGRKDEAERHVHAASEMLRRFPGRRLECFATYSRGVVACLHGETDEAAEALEGARTLAHELGDAALGQFAGIYLAEAFLLAGRYDKASSALAAVRREVSPEESPAIARMLHARAFLVETILGRRRRARGSWEAFDGIRRTDVVYLEAWNDLLVALARILGGAPSGGLADDALGVFESLGVPVGARLSRVVVLLESLARGDERRVRREIAAIGKAGEPQQRFLRVAEPLCLAEAWLSLGESRRAEEELSAASSAIIGCPYLELDLRLELLRARVAVKIGEIRDARRHLHRCLHARDLLLQYVPEGRRKAFWAHSRFAALDRTLSRLSASPSLELSTELMRRSQAYAGMVGGSSAMIELFRSLEKIRDQELPVLIVGETGTGKELVARAIHGRSPRRQGPFQTVSCACLSPELFESDLFGHVAGAFTGAEIDKPGILEHVSGGTLLLDEVGLLPLESQAKLLRVLESGAIRRIGDTGERRVDVRFLAITNADLRGAVEERTFRADLFFRLAGLEIPVPPLRARTGDIPLLARHFLGRHAERLDRRPPAIEPEALELLEMRDWPGNVRELEVTLLRALVLRPEADPITAGDVKAACVPYGTARRRDLLKRTLKERRDDLEREYLTQLFHEVGGDTQRMIEALGVKTTKLYAWFRRLGIDIRALREELRHRGTR